ncbi:MAG: nitroreductase family protein [Alphaproteobacteria bacterium]|nr:nitroreductase family protein [Alphaproteobacteria bacterium]
MEIMNTKEVVDMEFLQGLLTRRSIRQFLPNKTVSKETIKDILNVAMHAPSAVNSQPWEFIVIKDRETMNKMMEMHPHASFLKDASLAIVTCGNTKEQYKDGHWLTDSVAATQNLLLAVHEKGLGACWCGIFPNGDRMQDFSQLLGLPENIKPMALNVIGYPAVEPKQPSQRYNETKVHWEKW